jgi:hypothetical protein
MGKKTTSKVPAGSSASLEAHLSDFILRCCKGHQFKEYRKRCIDHWREIYGDVVADKVTAEVKARWVA